MEIWIKDNCPSCKTINWFCCGDAKDLTQPDIEVCSCFKCNFKWTDLNEADMEAMDITLESGSPTKGRSKP